ncbi:MAG: YncE family protein, partial [Candidatus Eiseniibacteriota bacterium]
HGEDCVAVIDVALRKVVKTVVVGRAPHMVLAAPNGATIYANCEGDNRLVAFDAATWEKTAEIPLWGVPRPFAFSPDGSKIFQTIRWLNGLLVIDTAKNQVVDQIALSGTSFSPEGREAHGCAITPDSTQLWLTTQNLDTLTILDARSFGVLGQISVGREANWVRFTPNGERAVVSLTNDDQVKIIGVAERKVIASVKVGSQPKRLAVGWVAVR